MLLKVVKTREQHVTSLPLYEQFKFRYRAEIEGHLARKTIVCL